MGDIWDAGTYDQGTLREHDRFTPNRRFLRLIYDIIPDDSLMQRSLIPL